MLKVIFMLYNNSYTNMIALQLIATVVQSFIFLYFEYSDDEYRSFQSNAISRSSSS
jgi:hypothetical protein